MIAIEKDQTDNQRWSVKTFEEFRAKPKNRGRLFELIHGEIVEKMPTEEYGAIALHVGSELRLYAKLQKNGRAGVEVRYQAANDNRNSRLPDVSFRLTSDAPIRKGQCSGDARLGG